MSMSNDARQASGRDPPRVVVVGPCASGKTTLVERLKRLGFDAKVSGQEHSDVRNLWRRLDPDVLIALDIDLQTLRSRRTDDWPGTIYDAQRERLREAFEGADAVIDTAVLTEDEVVRTVLGILEQRAGRTRSRPDYS